jgi:peroxiredoxin
MTIKALMHIFFVVSIFSIGNVFGNNLFDFKIIGHIKGYSDSTKLFLDDVSSIENKTLDSIFVIKGCFEFSGFINEGLEKVMIYTEEKKEFRIFWLEKSIIHIYSEDALSSAKITGCLAQEVQDKLDSQLSSFDVQERVVKQELSRKISDKKKYNCSNELSEIRRKRLEVICRAIRSNKNSLFGAALLNSYGSILPRDSVIRFYRSLQENFKHSSFGKDALYYHILTKNAPKVGDKYLDFEQPDQYGNIIKFSEIRGNLTLLEFWGSGCGPCRLENPNLVRIYNKFNDKGFEIISVAFDRRKESWAKAVKDDGLLWVNVSDLKFSSNAAGKIYGVRSIPTNFLINKEGIIIAINLRNLDLEQKIEEYFNQ